MRSFFIITVFLVAVVSSREPAAAQTPLVAADPLRHGHALLIGNSHYEDRGWPQLDDIPLQLKQLKEGLEFHFDTVEMVQDLKTDDLREKINRFIRNNGNEATARLLIYYAGHGYTEVIRNENRGYITGIDTPSVDGTAQAYNAARLKAIPMSEIRTPLQLAPAGHILFVFDSCFAGTIFTNRAGDDPPQMLTQDVVTKLMEKPARDFITAGGAKERVPAHSPIPGFFLAALNGDGEVDRYKLGVISAVDVGRYLRAHVLNLPGSNFTPQYGRLPDPEFTEGEFLFRIPHSGDSVAAQAWAAVKDSTSIAMLEQFRTLYPRSVQAPFAAARIEELKQARIVAVVPAVPSRPEPAPPRTVATVPPVAPAVPPATIAPCGGGARTVSFSSRCATPLSAAEERALKPKDVFRECDNCPEMVVVPAGSFMMGSTSSEIAAPTNEFPYPSLFRPEGPQLKLEGPQRRVTIARPFAVGRFAVTFDEWDACIADGDCNGYQPKDEGWGRGKRPVINVNWDDAKTYAAWLSRKTGRTYRLLSEAEREYAARAGTTTAFWWGPSISTSQANYDSNYTFAGRAEFRGKTVPVDSFAPNPWGLYNVHGNVLEWVEDCWHDSYRGAPSDGFAWTSACSDASRRVVRGGAWFYDSRYLRAASRDWDSTGYRSGVLGFRLARTLNP
jgi:formylglycine-generating enzyme required for sulfatase activity